MYLCLVFPIIRDVFPFEQFITRMSQTMINANTYNSLVTQKIHRIPMTLWQYLLIGNNYKTEIQSNSLHRQAILVVYVIYSMENSTHLFFPTWTLMFIDFPGRGAEKKQLLWWANEISKDFCILVLSFLAILNAGKSQNRIWLMEAFNFYHN